MSKEVIVSLSLQAVCYIAAGLLFVTAIRDSKRTEAYNAEVRRQNEEIRNLNDRFGTK